MTFRMESNLSLRVFHIIFVSLSIVVCLGFTGWVFWGAGTHSGQSGLGISALVFGILLIVYEVAFIKKIR